MHLTRKDMNRHACCMEVFPCRVKVMNMYLRENERKNIQLRNLTIWESSTEGCLRIIDFLLLISKVKYREGDNSENLTNAMQ